MRLCAVPVCITTETNWVLQAVERAISEIIGLTWPLRKGADVAQLTMGAKSKDKVLEILQTGTLRRNEAMADDDQQQVIQLVRRAPCRFEFSSSLPLPLMPPCAYMASPYAVEQCLLELRKLYWQSRAEHLVLWLLNISP